MSSAAKACSVAIAEGCKADILRRFLRVRGGCNWIDGPLSHVQREDAFEAVAVVVCRLGRLLRLILTPHDDLGPGRTALLSVLSCFDAVLHYYGWPDDPRGPGSMNDPDAWRAFWPVKGPLPPVHPAGVARRFGSRRRG